MIQEGLSREDDVGAERGRGGLRKECPRQRAQPQPRLGLGLDVVCLRKSKGDSVVAAKPKRGQAGENELGLVSKRVGQNQIGPVGNENHFGFYSTCDMKSQNDLKQRNNVSD